MIWIDTDAAIELAAFDLLDSLADAFDTAPGCIYYLEELGGRCANPGELKDRYSAEVFRRVLNSLQGWSRGTLTEEVAFAAISDFPDMDAEALLFAGALETSDSVVLLGDLRSVASFSMNASSDQVASLAQRVVILESAVLRIAKHLGWDAIRPKLNNCEVTHRELLAAICAAGKGGESAFLDSLQKSVDAVQGPARKLLWV